jgi:hypothetical protein
MRTRTVRLQQQEQLSTCRAAKRQSITRFTKTLHSEYSLRRQRRIPHTTSTEASVLFFPSSETTSPLIPRACTLLSRVFQTGGLHRDPDYYELYIATFTSQSSSLRTLHRSSTAPDSFKEPRYTITYTIHELLRLRLRIRTSTFPPSTFSMLLPAFQ